jgi:hypothetical protein
MMRPLAVIPFVPAILGAWLAMAAVATPARADAGPSCGKDHPAPPPRDGSLGFLSGKPRLRTAGGGLILVGGLASIWTGTRRRGGGPPTPGR